MSHDLGLVGRPPDAAVGAGNPEAEKYGRLWERDEYRAASPGEALVPVFLARARPRPGASLIDFGCGTGRGGRALRAVAGLQVTLVDFVRNSLDPDVRAALGDGLRFVKADLEQPLPVVAEYGYCTDVLEHVPPDRLGRVLDHVLKAAQHVFVSVATEPDRCGALIGEPLHLTVRPHAWWLDELGRRADVTWSEAWPGTALFLVTAWASGADVVRTGRPNAERDEVRANVAANLARGFRQAWPHPAFDVEEVVIIGGGPSLAAHEDAIRAHRRGGARLVTLNGAYGWARARGLWPVNQVVVDARAFNARFVRPADARCLYFLASQCHPSVFDGLPPDRVWLWHTNTDWVHDLLAEAYPGGALTIPGGSTVLLRAIPLLRLLGVRRFHLYGCDSCIAAVDGGRAWAHHAYAQPENDAGLALPAVLTGGKMFRCHPWMVSQAQEFIELIRRMGDDVELAAYGPGLLAEILRTGAALEDLDVTTEGGD